MTEAILQIKQCARCHEIKPIDEFYPHCRSKDKHGCYCKECSKTLAHDWSQENAERRASVAHERYLRQGDGLRSYSSDLYLRHKMLVVAHYSKNTNKCACCGEPDIRFLTIDHINGNGNQHRRSIGRSAGANFLRWLMKVGLPEGYQVLCYNCNMARARYGVCPHQIEARKWN